VLAYMLLKSERHDGASNGEPSYVLQIWYLYELSQLSCLDNKNFKVGITQLLVSNIYSRLLSYFG
jgi:hypothetical protein